MTPRMPPEQIAKTYLGALERSALETILDLYLEDGIVHSPLYGPRSAKDFYTALFKDTGRGHARCAADETSVVARPKRRWPRSRMNHSHRTARSRRHSCRMRRAAATCAPRVAQTQRVRAAAVQRPRRLASARRSAAQAGARYRAR